jgi:hypothetical protein
VDDRRGFISSLGTGAMKGGRTEEWRQRGVIEPVALNVLASFFMVLLLLSCLYVST